MYRRSPVFVSKILLAALIGGSPMGAMLVAGVAPKLQQPSRHALISGLFGGRPVRIEIAEEGAFRYCPLPATSRPRGFLLCRFDADSFQGPFCQLIWVF